jgi:hypothetical protein
LEAAEVKTNSEEQIRIGEELSPEKGSKVGGKPRSAEMPI